MLPILVIPMEDYLFVAFMSFRLFVCITLVFILIF